MQKFKQKAVKESASMTTKLSLKLRRTATFVNARAAGSTSEHLIQRLIQQLELESMCTDILARIVKSVQARMSRRAMAIIGE